MHSTSIALSLPSTNRSTSNVVRSYTSVFLWSRQTQLLYSKQDGYYNTWDWYQYITSFRWYKEWLNRGCDNFCTYYAKSYEIFSLVTLALLLSSFVFVFKPIFVLIISLVTRKLISFIHHLEWFHYIWSKCSCTWRVISLSFSFV